MLEPFEIKQYKVTNNSLVNSAYMQGQGHSVGATKECGSHILRAFCHRAGVLLCTPLQNGIVIAMQKIVVAKRKTKKTFGSRPHGS